jgi:hypothetical protein
MKKHQKRYQQYLADVGCKPKGKEKRYIEKQNRQELRTEVRKILKDVRFDDEHLKLWKILVK